MFNDIGAKIRSYAIATFWIAAISCIILAIYMIMKSFVIPGLLLAVFGLLFCYIETLFVAAIGELLDDVKANENNTAESRKLLAEIASLRASGVPKAVYVNAAAEATASESAAVRAAGIKKPEARWVSSKSSQALRLLDKIVKFNFKSNDDCMKWTVRNIAMLPDEDKAKLEELDPYIDSNDADGFVSTLYRLYTTIE